MKGLVGVSLAVAAVSLALGGYGAYSAARNAEEIAKLIKHIDDLELRHGVVADTAKNASEIAWSMFDDSVRTAKAEPYFPKLRVGVLQLETGFYIKDSGTDEYAAALTYSTKNRATEFFVQKPAGPVISMSVGGETADTSSLAALRMGWRDVDGAFKRRLGMSCDLGRTSLFAFSPQEWSKASWGVVVSDKSPSVLGTDFRGDISNE